MQKVLTEKRRWHDGNIVLVHAVGKVINGVTMMYVTYLDGEQFCRGLYSVQQIRMISVPII